MLIKIVLKSMLTSMLNIMLKLCWNCKKCWNYVDLRVKIMLKSCWTYVEIGSMLAARPKQTQINTTSWYTPLHVLAARPN